MHFSPLVTVACALALAPTAVVATTAAVAFVTVGSVDTCPRGLAQEVTPGPKVVTTAYTCEKAKISHDMSVSYYDFDIQPLNKETYKCCLKVYDNPACLGAAVIDLPVEGPAEDRCIPEYLFDDEVKYISFQLDCDQPYAKAEPHGKQYAEQGYQQAEHAPKQEAQKGPEEAEHAPKQEAQDDSEQGEQAPERTAGNPADNLGLGDLTKLLGFR